MAETKAAVPSPETPNRPAPEQGREDATGTTSYAWLQAFGAFIIYVATW